MFIFSDSKKAKSDLLKWSLYRLNRVIYSFYYQAPAVLLWKVVCGRPAAVECGNKACHQQARPRLWSSSHSSLAWRQQAGVNTGKLITSPQKDGWLNLLWFAVVLLWALALFKCAHHVQLQDKSTHSLPVGPSCWIQGSTADCQASGITKQYQSEKGWLTQEEERLTQKDFIGGALCFVFLRSTVRSVSSVI